MTEKSKETVRFIQSLPLNTIGRFQVKASILDNGVDAPSVMLIITDLVEKNFKTKFFKTTQQASDFIDLLKTAT